ncbi:MAG: hypothetical protein V3S31_01035 [Dehalococcoidia bacterium]
MLARLIEESGIATVVVTMMPALAEKFRVARVVGVEFPFGHAFGMPDDQAMQRTVAEAAVRLLNEATEPEARLDVDIEWPIDQRTAYRDWQPAEASPIVAHNIRRRQELEAQRASSD